MIAPETHIVARLVASAAVSALLANRIEPATSSEQTAMPRAVYTRISADHQHHMLAASGLVFYRVQFDIFAATQGSMDSVCEAIRNRLDGFRGNITTAAEVRFFGFVKLEGERDAPVDSTDGSDQLTAYRRSLDFFVSCAESIPALTA